MKTVMKFLCGALLTLSSLSFAKKVNFDQKKCQAYADSIEKLIVSYEKEKTALQKKMVAAPKEKKLEILFEQLKLQENIKNNAYELVVAMCPICDKQMTKKSFIRWLDISLVK